MYTFEDYKNKISIIQVAEDLGYEVESGKGLSNPQFRLYENGIKIDEIVIRNPNNSATQTYISRRGRGDEGGLIHFVLNRLDMFTYSASVKDYDAVNEILSQYMDGGIVVGKKNENSAGFEYRENRSFDIDQYNITAASLQKLTYLKNTRKIKPEILNLFLPHIFIVQDMKNPYGYINIGFPYRVPCEDNIVNFELRNDGYKAFCAGGNKSTAIYAVSWANTPTEVKKMLFFESAIDLMSFVQLYFNKLNFKDTAFISLGGAVARGQISGSRLLYPNAAPILCFDNDVPGNVFDINAAAYLLGKSFHASYLNNVVTIKDNQQKIEIMPDAFSSKKYFEELKVPIIIFKSKSPYKDFNEMLQHA